MKINLIRLILMSVNIGRDDPDTKIKSLTALSKLDVFILSARYIIIMLEKAALLSGNYRKPENFAKNDLYRHKTVYYTDRRACQSKKS